MPESRYLTVNIQMTPEQIEDFRRKWAEITKPGLDVDGPLQPMRPAREWNADAAAECEEHYRRIDRDAALIGALRFT